MTDFIALKNADPGGTLQAAFDAMRVETVTRYRLLSSSRLNKWAAATGSRKSLMMASEDYTHAAYELAAAARGALENINHDLDLNDAEVMGMLNSITAAGLITVSARDDLLSRALVTELKYPALTIGELERARAS